MLRTGARLCLCLGLPKTTLALRTRQRGWHKDVSACRVCATRRLHPAVEAGLELDSSGEEVSVQDAYTPDSQCFGCGARPRLSARLSASCSRVLSSGGCGARARAPECSSQRHVQLGAQLGGLRCARARA